MHTSCNRSADSAAPAGGRVWGSRKFWCVRPGAAHISWTRAGKSQEQVQHEVEPPDQTRYNRLTNHTACDGERRAGSRTRSARFSGMASCQRKRFTRPTCRARTWSSSSFSPSSPPPLCGEISGDASFTRRIDATLQTAAAKRAARMPVHADSAPLRLLPLVLLLLRHPCCCGPPGHACAHSHSQGCADCIDHDAPTLTHVGVRVPVHARVLTRCGASACGSCCRVGTWYYFCERHLCWRVAVVLRLEALTVDAAAPGFSSCGH